MGESAPILVGPPVTVPRRGATAETRICSGLTKTGKPCGQPALPGESLCRHHSLHYRKTSVQIAEDGLIVPSLPRLVAMDVRDPSTMEVFRRGLMAHCAKGTLTERKVLTMHALAMAIRDDAPKVKSSSTRGKLAGLIGGDRGYPGEIEMAGDGEKDPQRPQSPTVTQPPSSLSGSAEDLALPSQAPGSSELEKLSGADGGTPADGG